MKFMICAIASGAPESTTIAGRKLGGKSRASMRPAGGRLVSSHPFESPQMSHFAQIPLCWGKSPSLQIVPFQT